jgi:cell division protein FtsB
VDALAAPKSDAGRLFFQHCFLGSDPFCRWRILATHLARLLSFSQLHAWRPFAGFLPESVAERSVM